jgi:hypothetical protein
MTLVSEASIGAGRADRGGLALAGFAVAASWLFCSSLARAEDAETRTAARDLATQGGQAFDAGHYEQASDFFLRAYELVHAPSISLMRARSLAKVGQLVEAIDVYEQTARFKLTQDAPEAYVNAVETARTEEEAVRLRVPRLKISLKNANASAEVTIDDKPTPAALLGVDRPLNPGVHRIVVLVARQARATREIDLAEGKSYGVELDAAGGVPATGAGFAAGSASPGASEPSAHASMPTSRLLGYVGVGVGVVGLGVGTYAGLVALQHKSKLDDACHPGCPESSASDLSGFRTNRTVSWLSYGVGFAAATAGVLLLTVGNSRHEHVALRLLPSGVQIGGTL